MIRGFIARAIEDLDVVKLLHLNGKKSLETEKSRFGRKITSPCRPSISRDAASEEFRRRQWRPCRSRRTAGSGPDVCRGIGRGRFAALWRVPQPAEDERNGGKSREEDGLGYPTGIQLTGETPQGEHGIEIPAPHEERRAVSRAFFPLVMRFSHRYRRSRSVARYPSPHLADLLLDECGELLELVETVEEVDVDSDLPAVVERYGQDAVVLGV